MKTTDSIVYVIEDDKGSRDSTVCLLATHQIQSRSFESAEQFFSEIVEDPGGCILTDLVLPGMSGLQVITKSRDLGWAAPVIILTAFGEVATVVFAFKCGVYDFLEKPCLPSRLIKSVSDCLNRGATPGIERNR